MPSSQDGLPETITRDPDAKRRQGQSIWKPTVALTLGGFSARHRAPVIKSITIATFHDRRLSGVSSLGSCRPALSFTMIIIVQGCSLLRLHPGDRQPVIELTMVMINL